MKVELSKTSLWTNIEGLTTMFTLSVGKEQIRSMTLEELKEIDKLIHQFINEGESRS